MTLRLVDVWFKYPRLSDWIFKDLNISFNKNEITIVTGPNGSGKTTLLKIAGLLYKPDRGYVQVFGKSFWDLKPSERLPIRRRIVYVHEKPILLKGSVIYNIAYGLILRGIDKRESYSIVEEFVSKLGLTYLLKRDTRSLSAGEAQIISLLRAFVLEPEYLLLDEPFSHLDIEKRKLMINVVKELKLKKRIGVIIASHDTGIVEALGEKLYYIQENRSIVSFNKKQLA